MSDEPIREAIQKMLDAHGDGWYLAQHCVVMAIERVVDGRIGKHRLALGAAGPTGLDD